MVNSLAQLLIKIASPGVPDLYQGQELWDLSLVDPDSRRPVDFQKRARMLGELIWRLKNEDRVAVAADLLDGWRDGRIKMFVTHLALDLRRRMREAMREGSYVPLQVEGASADHVFAFGREGGGKGAIAVVPRLVRRLEVRTGARLISGAAWGDTRVVLPDTLSALGSGPLVNLFTGVISAEGELRPASLFTHFPVALLVPAGGTNRARER